MVEVRQYSGAARAPKAAVRGPTTAGRRPARACRGGGTPGCRPSPCRLLPCFPHNRPMPQALPPFRRSLLSPRHWPAWLGVGAIGLVACLPRSWLMRGGRAIGWLAAHVFGERREIAARNLELCFPMLEPAVRATLLERNLHDSGLMLAEFALAWMGSAAKIARIPVTFEGLHHLAAARA